ncbi:hypothetical protein PV328_003555 [Microctonus aethiopoides]|uniref:DNA polymerase zeta catalytic subunit n=1 Tax=Microctonus aethiopoides TaxID=144406 RepID=A0AA39KKS5_9HYME|nr:hypothetical protein PV328_003555 [Microctonus aethiopoides]
MFSVRLVTADSYQATPLPQLDPTYSEFRGTEIKHVPIVRVFGTASTGEKTCLHLHGVFPYMYVPFTGEDNANAYAYKLAASLDAAINISLGSAASNTQHVYQIQRIAGIPYYGYHQREHQFFKIYFYNPAMMKKAADLLQNGSVLNHRLQPHEAHIPFILQFMMDYNLHGMSLINLSKIKHRRDVTQIISETKSSGESLLSPVDDTNYLPVSVMRQSLCKLEVDALASDILNRGELEKGMELNPGLEAIWEEERARRMQAGLPCDDSQLLTPQSPKRPSYKPTESDIYQHERLNRRLEIISQCDESTLSSSTTPPIPYPLEVNDDDQLINASNLGSTSVNNLDKSQQYLSDVTSLTSFNMSQGSKNSQSTHDGSILDADDMPLVEMLNELARDDDNQETIDDDSVLGTQSSVFENIENKSDNEDEENVSDLNITCLELDSMSSWDNTEKSPSQLVPVNLLEVNTEVPHRSLSDILQDTDAESQDSEGSRLPQLDGAGDLSNFLESEEDESIKRCEELKRVSECQTPILNNNLSNSDNEAFIIEELISDLSKSNKNGNFSTAFISDGTWPSYLPNETSLEQFNTMNYEPLGSVFESDFDNVMGMSLLLSNNDETSVDINLSVRNEEIPLAAVLNGDPCFTQTAEMDKSDFAELQDQYVSLLDSALVPDIYKNSFDSDIVNSYSDRVEEKEMVSLNSRSFRFTTNSRNSNLSSENVTPNIQEPDAKVCKNKLSLPSAFDRIDENCKEFSRVPSDSSDYNCNVVATWEELQDPKFIPKRILKRKRNGKSRKRILTRRPILNDSMSARRKGRTRKGVTNNIASHIVQTNVNNIDSSSSTQIDDVPLKIDDETIERSLHEKSMVDDSSFTTPDDNERIIQILPIEEPRTDDLLHVPISSEVNQVPTRISPTNLDSDLNQGEILEMLPSESVTDVRNTLPGVQYSMYDISENENVVMPIIADFEELVDVSTENKISDDNNSQYLSHYSSARSHSGVFPFGKLNHRHCYACIRMGLIRDYVFTPDEIWVIEKRKRGKLRSLSSEICNKNCRLPFVPLQKLKIIDKSELNMTQLSISEMGPENFNLTCDNSQIDTVNDNYVNNRSMIHDFHQSESSKLIDIKDLSQISKLDEKVIEETPINCKINVKNDDNIISDNTQLPINDFASTQSAQISSTQNLDQFITNKKCESLLIERVYDDKSCRTDVSSNNRSILLKLNNKNKTEVVNSKVCSPKIVEFSKRKNNDHDNASETMSKDCIQLELMKNEREKEEKIIYPDVTSITTMQSNETKKLSEEKNHNSILTSIIVETKNPELHGQIMNMNEDETNIPKINLMINKESNIISSSQSESAILNKRPEIRCSIDRNKVDLTFITAKNYEKDDVKNVVNTSDFRRISLDCTESIDSQIFEDNIEVNIIPKNDISINSHEQQFNGFDDSTLDVHLCDSLYKDDVTSNNIFGTTESEREHTTSTDSCENDHESEQYTNAVAEANFYAGKNYTIDAISLEIPQCLFEEDSNSESTQRKSSDLLSENTLNAQTTEEFSIREIISDKSISDNCNNVSVNNFNLKQLYESNSGILSTTDNSSSGNVTRHDLSTLSDVRKSSTTQCSSETDELINENKSQNDSNYTCGLPQPPTSEQLFCPESCHDNSKDYFDVEMIARMLESILVLRENKTSYKSVVNKKNITQCTKKDLPNGSTENSNNLFRNSDENIVGSVIKYTPNKISIIRRIYLSKNKNTQKESNNLNVTTLNKNGLFIQENKLRNNHVKISEVKKIIETKINNEKLLDKVVSKVSENVKNQEIPVLENCVIICENSVTKNNDDDICMVKSQVYTHNNLSIAKSSKNPHNAKPINKFIHESNNNRPVPRLESLMIQSNEIPTQNIVNHSNKKVGIKIVEEPECILNHENNNTNPSEISSNISENVLVEAAHDNDHDDISQDVEHSETNQYQKTDMIINAVTCSVNSSPHVAMNVDGNKIEDSSINGNKSEKLDNVNSLEVSTGLEYNNEITAENCKSSIECNSHDEERVKSNVPSQTTAHYIDNDINNSIPIVKNRELSVVLERLDINILNKYLKNNQNVEVCDKSELKKLTFDKKTNSEKKSMKKKKCVRFNEQVFIFESNERAPLAGMEDQLHRSIVREKKNRTQSSSDADNLTEILEVTEDHETVQSMAQSSQEFINGKETSIVSENSIVNCNEILNYHDTEQKDNKIFKKVNEHVNEEIIHVDIDYPKLTKDCVKINEASIKDSIGECKSLEIDMLSDKNKIINSEKKEVTRDKPKIMINVIDIDEKNNSVVAINQNENVQIKKFTGDSKETKMRCAVVLELCDKSMNEHVANSENKKPSFVEDCSQKKNISQLIDKTNGHCDTVSHDKLSPVIEPETKAISNSNEISVISPVDEPNNSHTKSRCKRKRNNIPTTPNQSITNIPVNDISFVDDITNSYKCFQNSDRILRSYRTSSGYRNKIHTVSIDNKMVFTKVAISDQQLLKKSPKERFLKSIGLCSMKPRGVGWLPERTMTGSIQLQQPQVMLQRLTPSILKYYGYTRRFKSNRFGKRFKSSSDKINIPAYDGPADLSSSDSESDADVTLMSSEKRVCVYRSSKKNTEREAIVTPKKRKQLCSDDDAETNQHKHPKCSTSKLNITPSRTLYRSPRRRRTLRSPGGSGNYSPLKITVTSPKVDKIAKNDSNDSSHENTNVAINSNAMCATPKRRKRLMYEKLLRNRIMPSSTSKHEDNVRGSKINATQQLMGELNILNSSVTVPNTQSSTAPSYHECQSEDVFPNVKDTMNIRKNLFSSNANNPKIGVLSSQNNVEITNNDNCIKNITISCDPEIAGPSTSGYINFNVKDHSEREDDEETVIFEESGDEICLKYSPSVHSNEELDANNEDDLCDVTFTQYLNSHEMTQQQNLFSNSNRTLSDSKKITTIVPKFNSPTVKQIIDTMEIYNIPKFKNLEPFFSNQADAPGQKELAHKMLNVPGKGVTDLSAFKSSMENITGINRWRKMKINEFHPTPGAFKSTSIRQSLAGHSSVVITPLLSTPTRKSVIKWLRARDYLKKKEKDNADKAIVELKKFEKNIDHLKVTLQNECSYNSDSSVVEGSPDRIVVSSSSNFSSQTWINNKIDESRVQTELNVQEMPDDSSITSKSSSSIGEVASSLRSILAKSALFKSDEQTKPLGMSFGQIECLTNSVRTNVDNENMQKCKALTRYQYITIFCVEVHVITRDDLLPDPQHDSISALFYAIQSDVPPTSTIKPLEHGVIAVCTEAESKSSYCYGSNIPFVVNHVNDEKSLFETFINIIKRSDAEILIGWEIESLSWGYIFQRALRLGINFIEGISRVPTSSYKRDNQMSNNLDSFVDTKLPGRIVLDIWRIMKSEIALLTYTFENVMYHVMNERLPCPAFKSLTNWWNLPQSRWKVVQHYNTKILGILRILEQLDIIGRTSEYARLFGIQFYEVFSRGSQFRVESIMLRLAKPLNFVAVSPSAQQRASMRAMEALPLIMEPESMFYSDPIVVLDFQSLYPSIIIAHNYCFSTCLGRVEHIGQPDPFEFGATILRIPKHTALRLKGKINYSPCGVAFVKQQVRRGILPRMLTEILNTRLMVKKAMKDHSHEDKLLQRVLHSRQKGLKDLANVTYGYTAANFTGRMPCMEVGDSVISKAKETLERAIKLVESTPKWGARVIYGDTDSLFILVPGKSKDDAFKVGYEIADAVTASNLSPIKLKFEKILCPAILQTKKRYCGYMYETPEQKEPIYLAKGIETVRRDGCPAVSKILEKSLRILFNTKDVSLVKQYVTRQLDKVLSGKVSLEDLTFAKEFRGLKGYRERACVPALELTRRLMKKDPRAIPRRSERVRYIIVAGAPNQALIHCVRSPWELINDPGLRPNATYYVTRVIIPPLNRCLNLMGVDVNMWYKDMPRRQILDNPAAIPDNKQKQTIFQYFGTIVCASCGRTSNKGICTDCLAHPTDTLIILHERLRWLERINSHVTMICQSCVGRGDIADCISLDCPVLYRRAQAQRDLTHQDELRQIIESGGKLEF